LAEEGLGSSNATWKIVSSDVPLSIATGTRAEVYGRDAFADGDPAGAPRTGSETELRELLSHLDRENVRNVVFVVTDVHFATSLRYEIDLDSDGDKLLFHELVTGPLSAGLVEPRTPDATFAPRVLYAEGGIFNFVRFRGGLALGLRGTGRPGSRAGRLDSRSRRRDDGGRAFSPLVALFVLGSAQK
jgi:alkaline phosphatase D